MLSAPTLRGIALGLQRPRMTAAPRPPCTTRTARPRPLLPGAQRQPRGRSQGLEPELQLKLNLKEEAELSIQRKLDKNERAADALEAELSALEADLRTVADPDGPRADDLRQSCMQLRDERKQLRDERIRLLDVSIRLLDDCKQLRELLGLASAPTPDLLTPVKLDKSPSELASKTEFWHRYAYQPGASLTGAAFFGFLPGACLPVNIPPELVSPVYGHILRAAAAAAQPPADLDSRKVSLQAVRDLQKLGSGLHGNEASLQMKFLTWHNNVFQARDLTPASIRGSRSTTDGMHTISGVNGEEYVVCLLEVKNEVPSGYALVQALRYYQMCYKDGECWTRSDAFRADPLPALVLLLEGPRLSFHAVWTIYQNRVAYAPLTPCYWLANEGVSTATTWQLMAVLEAYLQAAEELAEVYKQRQALPAEALERMAQLRTAAHEEADSRGARHVRPCTLPYSLLDEQLGLSSIAFRGPCFLYEARQRLGTTTERRVLVKFVARRYGDEVHRAWHTAGLAPALYDVRAVGSYVMVVMQLLAPEDGWMHPDKALAGGGGGGGGGEAVKAAVRGALQRAHAVRLPGGSVAAHGDMRLPNVMVRPASGGWEVAFIDFDWAGPDGRSSYPLALSDVIRWPEGVRPGAAVRQAHDTQMLEQELEAAA